jgi:hypothetical protein
MLLYNLLDTPRLRTALLAGRAGTPAAGRRFFANHSLSSRRWLTERGASERLEECAADRGGARGGGGEGGAPGSTRSQLAKLRSRCEGELHRQDWWAFDCGRTVNRSRDWQPWMPPESFD